MKVEPTGGRLISFGGNTVRFSSDHLAILKAIDTHFAHCSTEVGPLIADYHIAAITETGFSVSANSGVLYPQLTFEQVLWNLMQDALTRLNGSCITGPVLHAAALENTGNDVILCGQSGSGKSSLAAWLLANGFRYLTDEVVVCSQDGERIDGFTRSLILKRGSAFIWQHWLSDMATDKFLGFADGSAWIDPLLFNADGISTQVEPRLLVFPVYAPEAAFCAERLSPAETLFHLLQNLVNARNIPDHGLTVAARLARRVKAFSLIYSDIESATKWIKQTTLTR
jgi:hypothetical protein